MHHGRSEAGTFETRCQATRNVGRKRGMKGGTETNLDAKSIRLLTHPVASP